jgi:hypothetical protein
MCCSLTLLRSWSLFRRFVISFTHWTMQRKGARIGEAAPADAKIVDDPLYLGIHARETPEERSLRKRVFLRDDLPWCAYICTTAPRAWSCSRPGSMSCITCLLECSPSLQRLHNSRAAQEARSLNPACRHTQQRPTPLML